MAHTALDPSFTRTIIAVLATWVLFLVFVVSAIAFALTIFGVIKPESDTRKYLFALFSASSVGIFIGWSTNFLNPDLSTAKTDAAREVAAEQSRAAPPGAPNARITVYVQVSNDAEKGKFNSVRATLPAARFSVPGVESVNARIGRNQVRYCNEQNKKDADDVKGILEANKFQPFEVVQIANCSKDKNRNIVEVWLQQT